MGKLIQKLNQLEEISNNPNLNGGVWNSLNLFISTSDGILKGVYCIHAKFNKMDDDFNELSIPEERKSEILNDLISIRTQLQQKCGIKQNTDLEKKKNSRCNGHKFRAQVSKFLESYKGRFLVENN